MSRTTYSDRRQAIIHGQTDKLNRQINRAQKALFAWITESFLSSLPTGPDGTIVNDQSSIFLPQKIDNAYDVFNQNQINPILAGFTANVDRLIRANKGFYADFGETDDEQIENEVLGAIGLSGGVVLGGSLLFSILTDREIASAIKTTVMTGIAAGLTITGLKIAIEEIVLRKGGGIVKQLFEKRLPEPYVTIDRFIGKKYAVALKLNYAVYQGGTIKTSRDFCIHRNNKVFSRDEIMKFGTPHDKFGGYTDKAAGEFQGKTDPYNPLEDLGGYNCRHSYDWISDELAFHLRPELRGRS